jgi:hypothetical protein
LQLAAETRAAQALVSSCEEDDDEVTSESSVKQAFNQPALGFSTTLALVCSPRGHRYECALTIPFRFRVPNLRAYPQTLPSFVGITMLFPDTEEEWLNMEVLEQLEYPVMVLEKMWWMTSCEEVDSEGENRAVLHVVTITAQNDEGFTILVGSGVSMEVEKSTVLKEIDVHNGIVLNVNSFYFRNDNVERVRDHSLNNRCGNFRTHPLGAVRRAVNLE